MATISVKFRQSTVEGKAGTVFYQVIHKRRMARINTDIHLQPCDWRKVSDRKNGSEDYLMLVRNKIDSDLSTTALIINDCEDSGNEYSAKTIVQLFKNSPKERVVSSKNRDMDIQGLSDFAIHNGRSIKAFFGSPPHGGVSGGLAFSSFMLNRIAELHNEKRHSTAANYQHTLNSFSSFVESENVGCVTFSMIMDSLMERYESWMKSRGVKRNTTSFYMRILRAVYNLAVKQGLTEQTYPFRKVYTSIDTTRKRAVGENVIRELNSLDLADKPNMQMAKDMFLFSFATCGMPFVDMAHLKHGDIKEGYIKYERHKTGQPLQVKVTPFVEGIIKRCRQDNSPYIFPILTPSPPLGEGLLSSNTTAHPSSPTTATCKKSQRCCPKKAALHHTSAATAGRQSQGNMATLQRTSARLSVTLRSGRHGFISAR